MKCPHCKCSDDSMFEFIKVLHGLFHWFCNNCSKEFDTENNNKNVK